jgi:KipI family sensor histidine kinase inhibitor
MRILPAGDAALLVEMADLPRTLALYRALREQPVNGVCELVPAARTLLVHYAPWRTRAPALAQALRARAEALAQQPDEDAPPGRLVEIPVHYDGEDLAEAAALLGLSVSELVERHAGSVWQAAFAGFAPGFVYLSGGDAVFTQVPRRKAPRTKVPAGSVAIAGDFSAVYPAASPGGWQLIGQTDVAMWDLARAEPAYVQPGFRVRFVDAGARSVAVTAPVPVVSKQNVATTPGSQALPAIAIMSPGLQTLVQDAGRHGLSGLGISPSGALDGAAMRAANRLVGNPAATPVLENLLGGLRLRCHGRAVLAVTGAPMDITLYAADGRAWPVASHAPIALDDGDELALAAPASGVRCYLAVRGGWQVAPVLGSCSRDTLAQVGPAALAAGDRIAVGSALAPGELCAVQTDALPVPALPRTGDEVWLDVIPGPRTDWFTPEALALLARQPWRVTPQSNRVGMRLHGAMPLARSRHDELPSEGTATGAIQVPASGQPVLFLADHPLTGGYPVIAVVARHHLDLAAQIPVGCSVRFRVVAPFSEQVLP